MNDLEKQFRRVERAFDKVLDIRDRDPVEYEDDVWCYIQNCWHLKDWMRTDGKSLHKNVRKRVDTDVNSFWKLVLLGDLTDRSRHLKINDRETADDIQNRELRIVSAQKAGDDSGEIILIVTDGMKLDYPVRDLAKDTMRIWHTLFKLYGLRHLLEKSKPSKPPPA
jgi:hypothetical protein